MSEQVLVSFLFWFCIDNGRSLSSKNEEKEAYENIKQICNDLKKQTNCPEEDLKDFLEFISKQWNK